MHLGKVANHKKANQDDGLIPLINIVFLMLIFFMVAGHIERTSPIDVMPPVSISETHQAQEPLELIISSTGELAFNYQRLQQADLQQAIELAFEQAEDKEQFKILVKVDGHLEVDALRETLSIIKHSGIKRVALATQYHPAADHE